MDGHGAYLKKVAISFAAVLGFVLGALLAVPWFINGNSYKDALKAAVLEATGRELTIVGDITPAVLPWPSVRIEYVHLANRNGGSDADMIRADAVKVNLALLPLLTGRLQADQVVFERPWVLLEQTAEGANWEFTSPTKRLADTEGRRSEGLLPAQPGTAAPISRDRLAGLAGQAERQGFLALLQDLVIKDGTIVYRSGRQEQRISGFDGTLAAQSLKGPFKGQARFAYYRPGAKTGVPFSIEGASGALDGGKAAPLTVRLSLDKSDAALNFAGLMVGSTAGRAVTGELKLSAKDSADVAMRLGLKQAPTTGPIAIYARTQVNADRLALDDLSFDIGESHVQGKVLWDRSVQPGQVDVRLSVGSVDLDRWQQALAEQSAGSDLAGSPAAPPPPEQADGQSGQPDVRPNEPAFALPIPTTYRGTVDLKLGALTWRGMVLRQGHLALSLDQNGVQVDELTVQLPGSASVTVAGRLLPASLGEGGMGLDLAAQGQSDDFRTFVRWLGADVSDVPGGRLRRVQLAASITGSLREVAVRDVEAVVDTTLIRGAATVRPVLATGQRPAMGLTLEVGPVNLDAYRTKDTGKPADPPPQSSPAADTSAEPVTERLELAPVSSGLAKPTGLIDHVAGWVRAWDANMRLRGESVLYNGVAYKELAADATMLRGVLSLHYLGAKDAAGASVTLSGDINAADATTPVEMRSLSLVFNTPTPQRTLRALGLARAGGWGDGLGNADPLTFEGTLSGPLGPSQDHVLTVGAMMRWGSATSAGFRGTVRAPLSAWGLGGTLTARASDARQLVRLMDPDSTNQAALGAFDLHSTVASQAGKASFEDLSIALGPDRLTGTASADWVSGPRPVINADLRSDRLVLDRYAQSNGGGVGAGSKKRADRGHAGAEVQLAQATPAPLGHATSLSDAPSLLQMAALPAGRWSTRPFDRQPWMAVDASLALKAGFLSWAGVEIDQADIAASLQNGVLTVSRLAGALYGGPFSGTASFNVQSDLPTFTLAMKAKDMALARALKALNGSAAATGTGELSLDLAAHGISESSLINSLSGQGQFVLDTIVPQAGGSKSSALVAPIAALNAFSALARQDKGGAARLNGGFTAQNGILSLQGVELTSTLYQGRVRGLVNLPLWTLDVNGEAQVSETVLSTFLQQKLKLPSTIPLAIYGPLESPTVRVNTGAVSSGRDFPAAAGQILPGLLGSGGNGAGSKDAPQQPAVKPEKAARDVLKGLLFGKPQ